ncbi:putative ER lumen protein retaining receptor [Lupinus albus]|uniref:Putative ER lumen protein retaining receptor n=1 Tax=Lupinus albus TaxID=3870 RepID=A0A6A4PP85_LUPAL|nr:putative ER lumen protein retaining receptor [Lupinus albus]
MVVPCAVLAVLIHPSTIYTRIGRILWAFSTYLEAVSVVPQIRYMQNAKMIETLTGKYVFALGVSKFFGMGHWLMQVRLIFNSFDLVELLIF